MKQHPHDEKQEKTGTERASQAETAFSPGEIVVYFHALLCNTVI